MLSVSRRRKRFLFIPNPTSFQKVLDVDDEEMEMPLPSCSVPTGTRAVFGGKLGYEPRGGIKQPMHALLLN